MASLVIVLFAAILLIMNGVHCDCGCNKLKRDELKIEKSKSDKNDDNKRSVDQEMCSAPQQSKLVSWMHDENDGMALIPAGEYSVGTDDPIFPEDRESPERLVRVHAFFMDKVEVSNEEFEKFVHATNHLTEAEQFGDSFVFKGLLSSAVQKQYHDFRVANAPWWFKINDTNWRQPEGVGSSIANRMDHPVVHVSWSDATAFCKWKNKRLPTEDEWEVACRGGKKRKLFPWGNKLNAKEQHW